MKAENMFIGQRVEVKSDATGRHGFYGFYSTYLGRTGVISNIELGGYLDVRIKFDSGTYDWGNHRGIRKVKEV